MASIVDQFGRPIDKQVLREPQTSRLGTLYQEFGTHPTRGLTPAKLARILDQAEQGDLISQADLFEDMEEKDGHIFAEMMKRRRALLCLDWDIVPPRNPTPEEEKTAEFVKEIIKDLPFWDDLLLDMGDAIGKGYSHQEITWALHDRTWLPDKVELRPASWFMVTQDRQNDLRLRNNTMTGEALIPFGWIQHIHKAKSGYIARAGLHRILAWPFLFKNYSVRDLAEFLEIYGLPLRVGSYPPGSNDREKATLLNAVLNIGHAAAGIIPDGMKIDFQNAAQGTHDPFQAMLDWCERTQSKVILGATLTSQTDSGSGAYALGAVHNEIRHDLIEGDARQYEKTLTRDLVYPIVALNRPGVQGPRRAPRFVFDTREYADLKLLSESLPNLVDIGARIPLNWVNDQTGIPIPDEKDPVLERRNSPALPPFAGLRRQTPAAIAALRAEAAAVPPDLVDLSEGTADPLRGWLDAIRAMAAEADSLEALRDRLLTAYGDLPTDQLAEVMGLAYSVAEARGREDVVTRPTGPGSGGGG